MTSWGGIYELATVGTYLSPCFIRNPQYQSLVCTSSTDGIASVGSTNNIRAYPNPFDQSITIDADIGSPGEVKIVLYSILGQVIASDDYGLISDAHFEKTISTAGLNAGIYLLRVTINGSAIVFKLIKN